MQLTEANLYLEKIKYSKSHSENHTTRLGKKVRIKLDQIWTMSKNACKNCCSPIKSNIVQEMNHPSCFWSCDSDKRNDGHNCQFLLVCEFLHVFHLPWFNELQLGSSFPELEVSGRWYRKAFQEVLWDKRVNCGKHFQKLSKVMPNMPKS